MPTQTEIARAYKELAGWYRAHKFLLESDIRPKGRDPYRCLILFLLSPRSSDARLTAVCREFFHKYPTLGDLCLALKSREAEDDVWNVIRPLGRKKGHLHSLRSACFVISKKHAGKIPQDEVSLQAFYGIGPKISACIIAYG